MSVHPSKLSNRRETIHFLCVQKSFFLQWYNKSLGRGHVMLLLHTGNACRKDKRCPTETHASVPRVLNLHTESTFTWLGRDVNRSEVRVGLG